MLGLSSAQQRQNPPLAPSLAVLMAEESSGALNTAEGTAQEMGQGLCLSISPPDSQLYCWCFPVKGAITRDATLWGTGLSPILRCVD